MQALLAGRRILVRAHELTQGCCTPGAVTALQLCQGGLWYHMVADCCARIENDQPPAAVSYHYHSVHDTVPLPSLTRGDTILGQGISSFNGNSQIPGVLFVVIQVIH